jgi:molybdate transport system regulatory protein
LKTNRAGREGCITAVAAAFARAWGTGYTDAVRVRWKVWIEKDKELVFSGWRALLLEAIDETGSLSEAASRLGVHYRIAWGKVRKMEQRLGIKLVEGHSGGIGGGGARLTPAAREFVQRYRQLTRHLDEEVERKFTELFGDAG